MPESMSEERLAHISLYFDRRSISPDDSSNTVWRFGRHLRDEVVHLRAELAKYEPVIRAAREWHFHGALAAMDDYALICNALHKALEALGPELPKE